MEKELRLYKYVDGVADTPFPSLEEQAVLRTFTYSAKRMGGAPSIAGTIMYESCLDSLWSNKVYATFNGEKYFVRRTPSSSHSNTDSRYRHDVELISERASLDEVYFFDVVTVDGESDKPQSNNSNVVFFGDIFEFVSRLNKSLTRSGLGYHVQVDAGVTSEAKLVTLKDQFVTNALQEIPKLYNLKYYFDGKTIHVGDASLELVDTFQYGSTSALLSINKNNSNSRIVNRCSGLGGSKNIPYFYPNKSPYGDVAILLNGSSTDRATVFSWERFAKCGLSKTIVYKEVVQGGTEIKTYTRDNVTHTIIHGENDRFEDIFTKWEVIPVTVSVYNATLSGRFTKIKAVKDSNNEHSIAIRQNGSDFYTFSSVGTNPWSVDLDYGDYELVLKIPYDYGKWNSFDEATEFEATLTETKENVRGWFVDGNEMLVDLSSLGITFIGTPANGDTISFELRHDRIPVSANLMPYIYRESMGEERFYNAVDGEIKVGDEVIGNYKFSNPYFEGDPREHIESFDDIYPTIEGITNASGQRVDEFVEFAYDEYDSDEKDENNNPTHPYFYARLRKFDGANGFNLFTHAIESGAMSLSVKDGACGGCEWKIQIDENTNLNPVQVWEYDQYDENGVLQRKGTLKRDANGNVLRGAPQEMQNDTTMNEVWVALRKDDSTFGVPMPNAKNNYKPSSGDKFVILNISLPQSYIEVAEKKLSKAVVDYMDTNNSERFNFGIKFSRIYLEENEDNVLKKLSENIRLRVSYDDRVIPLYASGFTYKMDALSPLPEVTVELEDNVSVLNDRLSVIVRPLYMQAIENAQKEVVSKVLAEPSFASTTKPNVFAQDATFNKNVRMDGVVSSSDYVGGLLGGQGWGIYKSLDGKTVFEVDEVVARRGFKTVEFVVNETKAQKGEYLITLGNCKVSHVDEYDTYYRCYYDNHGNTDVSGFAVNDQAICRVYDESYANVNKYYWRLVVGVGFDYVDLSKLDFDGDGIPTQNDVLVQLGNRDDVARQNAIAITSAPTPSIIQYKGISGYSITQDNVVTKLSPDENILTGKVVMQSGSKGLENFEEWAEKQAQIDGFEYLREAMANDTTIEGGLIQSSLLRLGYKQNGEFVAMSGTSGLYDSDDAHGGIAAWYGGDMVDAENNPNSSRAAQALFRMDGTGYLAGGKITWDKNGSGSVAGGSLKWDKDGYITLANEIYLGDDEEETLGSILNKVSGIGSSLSDMFTVVESNGAKYIRANYDFFSVGGVTAGGIGSSSGGSGGGGSSTLSGLNDVALKDLAKDNMLAYNGTHWVNIDMASIKPDLTEYATQSWVEGKGYALNTALLAVDERLANVETIFTADQDGAINKWSEVVAFLEGIEGDTLDSILEQFAAKDSVYTKTQVDNTLSNYLLKSGGYMTGTLTMFRGSQDGHKTNAICFDDQHWRSYLYQDTDVLYWGHYHDPSKDYILLNSGNYTDYTVPKTGGTLTGNVLLRPIDASDVSISFISGSSADAYYDYKIGKFTDANGKSAFGIAIANDVCAWYKFFGISVDGLYNVTSVDILSNMNISGNVTAPTFIGNLQGTAGRANIISLYQANVGLGTATYGDYGGFVQSAMGGPSEGTWYSRLKVLHDNSKGYYQEIAMPFFSDDLYYRRMSEGVLNDWVKIPSENSVKSIVRGIDATLIPYTDGVVPSGWHRVAVTTRAFNAANNIRLKVARMWNNNPSEAFVADISACYGKVVFSQVSGCAYNRLIDKIRVVGAGDVVAYVDVHFKSSNTNICTVSVRGTANILSTIEYLGDTDVDNQYVFSIIDGASFSDAVTAPTFIGNLKNEKYITLNFKNEEHAVGSMSSANQYLPSGTSLNITPTDINPASSNLVVLSCRNGASGTNNAYFGAVNSGETNNASHFVIGRRTGVQSWAESLRVDKTGNVGIGTTAPSEKLHVNGSVRIGDAVLTWDSANGGLKVSHANGMSSAGFYATGYISAGGVGSGSSTGGGGASYNRLDAWADYSQSKAGYVLSALLGKDLDTRVNALANAGYITSAALDPYAKSSDVANTYATQTALQGVDIRVQAIEYIFEEDQDGVINKWQEIVDFLAGVEGTTLDSILEQFATKDSLSGYMPKTGGTFSGSVKVIKDFGGNLSDFATKQHYGAFEVGRASNNMCLAIGVTDDDYGYIQSKGMGVTNQGKLVLNPMGGSLYYSAELKPIFHEGNYTNYVVKKTGGVFSGGVGITYTPTASGFNSQHLYIESGSTSDIVGQPGIGFHCPNVNWGVLKLTSRGFEFCTNDLASRMNVVAKTFIGNLQGNADSATKLATPRTIWGKRFDGTGDVDGPFRQLSEIYGDGELIHKMLVYPKDPFGLITRAYISGCISLQSQREDNDAECFKLSLNPLGGNVGIGTTDPAEKLDVVGNIKTSGSVRIGDAILSWDATNKCVTIKNANTGEKASLFVDGGVTGTAIN